MGIIVVVRDVLLELVDEQRGSLSATPLVAHRVFNFDFVQDSAVIKFDEEGVANGALGGFMVFFAESLLLNTVNLGTESIDAGVSSGSISADPECQ